MHTQTTYSTQRPKSQRVLFVCCRSQPAAGAQQWSDRVDGMDWIGSCARKAVASCLDIISMLQTVSMYDTCRWKRCWHLKSSFVRSLVRLQIIINTISVDRQTDRHNDRPPDRQTNRGAINRNSSITCKTSRSRMYCIWVFFGHLESTNIVTVNHQT